MFCYSPSQTDSFLECELAWHLKYVRKLRPPYYNHIDIAAAIGSAFATYMEHECPSEREAQRYLEDELDQRLKGKQGTQSAEDAIRQAPSRLTQFIELYHNEVATAIPAWTVHSREESLGKDFGYARPDVTMMDDNGELHVVDYKLRRSLPNRSLNSVFKDIVISNQFLHYDWACSEFYSQPVSGCHAIVLRLDPDPKMFFWSYEFHPETISSWLTGRRVVWERMAAARYDNVPPVMASNHNLKFGLCDFYGYCFDKGMDEDFLQNQFKILER